MAVRAFTVEVADEVLADLRGRLRRTRWPDAVAPGWAYGAELAFLRQLCAYWAEDFDWRRQEAALNALPQFRAAVDGVGLHFVHHRSAVPEAMPVMLLHGWPATFTQMTRITPLLIDPAGHGAERADAFHVVVPSLPGFGFSDRPTQPGVDNARIAEWLHRLMSTELGYARYAVRASDIGAGVAVALALAHPEAVIGVHLSGSNPFLDLESLPGNLSPAEQDMVEAARRFRTEQFAYALLQASTPQTPAFALNDSPAGLAAWIVEKYRNWSDSAGQTERPFTREELLTTLTIYWVTETIASSMRLYYENTHSAAGWGRITVPVGFAMLPADMFCTPREWMERSTPVAHWSELPRGGHFGEHEVPELIATDLRAFLRPLR